MQDSQLSSRNPSFVGDEAIIRALQQEADEAPSARQKLIKRALKFAALSAFGAAAFATGFVLGPNAKSASVGSSGKSSPDEALYAMVQNNVQLANSDTIYHMNKLAPALEQFIKEGTVPSDVPREFMVELEKLAPPLPAESQGLRRLAAYKDVVEEIRADRNLQSSAQALMNNVYNYVQNGVENMPRTVSTSDDIIGIARSGSSCYIVAKETDSSGDWWNNLSTGIIDVLNVEPSASGSYGSSIRGFRGFASAYNEMRLDLWRYIKADCVDRGTTRYNFGGYSRGGAISTIAAAALVQEGRLEAGDVSTATYGAPRALSTADSDRVHGIFREEYRVTYKGDPVPSLPYGWMGAKHQGFHRCYDCSYDAGRDRPGFGWPTDSGDHSNYPGNVFPVSSFSSSRSHINV